MQLARNGFDARAKPITIAFGTGQFEREPVISEVCRRRIGVQQNSFSAKDDDEGIDPAVVVIIGKGGAAADFLLFEVRPSFLGNVGKRAVAIVAEEQI